MLKLQPDLNWWHSCVRRRLFQPDDEKAETISSFYRREETESFQLNHSIRLKFDLSEAKGNLIPCVGLQRLRQPDKTSLLPDFSSTSEVKSACGIWTWMFCVNFNGLMLRVHRIE